MPAVDLHLHSSASDGLAPPEEVVRTALQAGLDVIALTDHDTLNGVPAACRAAETTGLRVVPGTEFSVQASWGEMHLLAYFLPLDDPDLEQFLEEQRELRIGRARKIVSRLNGIGKQIELDDVLEHAGGGAVGRPHIARALVNAGYATGVQNAFERFIGYGRQAFVPKKLPGLAVVTRLITERGGVSSAAHLRYRADIACARELKAAGVDALEALHPSHDESQSQQIAELARNNGMLVTGGSDWHGDEHVTENRAALGSLNVPYEWFQDIERLSQAREKAGG